MDYCKLLVSKAVLRSDKALIKQRDIPMEITFFANLYFPIIVMFTECSVTNIIFVSFVLPILPVFLNSYKEMSAISRNADCHKIILLTKSNAKKRKVLILFCFVKYILLKNV
jgi:hypothetical protein